MHILYSRPYDFGAITMNIRNQKNRNIISHKRSSQRSTLQYNFHGGIEMWGFLALSENRFDIFFICSESLPTSNILLEYTIIVNSTYGIVYLVGDYYMVNPLERENFKIKENKIIKLPGFAILSFCLIQLERTPQLCTWYNERGWACPPPSSPGWADFSIMMEMYARKWPLPLCVYLCDF